ncbi:MAG: helix-hairpin-helix domain-containing protein [Verrucomicrobia bacterium]|nr:helix-hairpin-helix domain-containing protein [Verrucomicrobiota bacterium]
MLIIVMWVCLGLIALALYFANSMSSELRAADNRVTEIATRQAIAGATRYVANILTQYAAGGVVPSLDDYKAEELEIGDAACWFIGRNTDEWPRAQPNEPYFALVDEASKLNLNTATSAMIQALPIQGMTQEFADAIVAWRSATSQNAAYNENIYSQLEQPRHNKGAAYETVDEVRLINGAMLDLLFGEDTNRNGVLDANEDDGETSAPRDDQNGTLLAGLLEYVTVYSREPATSAAGSRRINVTQLNTLQTRQQLQQRLTQRGITSQRAAQIMARIPFNQNQGGPGQGGQNQPAQAFTSVADFMVSTQITAEEFALVHTELTASTATNGTTQGLINVNTASAAVLACIPGIGQENAQTLVNYRQSNPTALTSFAWLTQVLSNGSIRQAGRYITDQSYQFSADIVAVGLNGRGYGREKVVFDTRAATPRIIFRQDLTSYGWALGAAVRQLLRQNRDT